MGLNLILVNQKITQSNGTEIYRVECVNVDRIETFHGLKSGETEVTIGNQTLTLDISPKDLAEAIGKVKDLRPEELEAIEEELEPEQEELDLEKGAGAIVEEPKLEKIAASKVTKKKR